jgi:hypothetical protein
MMELFAKRMTWELDNEEGLSCLFFELEDGYFTLSRKTGAEALRLEMNDPANGQLIDPDCFEYALDNTRFRLNIVRNNRKVLRYLEEHHINTELYGEIVLHYTPLSKPQLESLSAVTLRLFFGELLFRRKQKCRWQKSREGITMVKIHRIWFNTERMDREDHYKITLFSRPRVSIHVDEYIWSFIEENIVKPHKLMRSEKHGYLLDISFDQFDPAKHRYFPLSSYNGLLREGVEMDSANRSYFREDFAGGKDRTTWFSPNKIWTNCGDKVLNVDIKAANVSENITPREYADLLFDGIGAALVFNFKRLKREEFDGLKPKIDWSIVESFPFPAPFEEQRYIGDEGEIHVYSWDGRKETTLVGPYSVRKLYLEHFGES